jgi:hypothetical protein
MGALKSRILPVSVAVAGCLTAGWFMPVEQPSAINTVQVRQTDWRLLPLPNRSVSNATLPRVASASLWGPAERSEAPAAVVDPSWRVAGLFGVGPNRLIRVEFKDASRPAQTLKVGDSLPTGHRITEIGDRHFCIRIGQKTYTLGVERREQD